MPPDLAIIIPVFNEQDNILPLAREVAAAMSNLDNPPTFEILFVDDASTDETSARIREATREIPQVRGLQHRQNAGQSAALWTGIQGSNTLLIATLDGDGQNDPADLPHLIKALPSADFICGHRTHRQDSWMRKTSSAIARSARSTMLKSYFKDTGCALRLFRRSALQGVFPFHGFHRVLPVLVQAAGVSCLEIPVRHRPRQSGVSKYGISNRLWRGIHDLIGLRWYLKRQLTPMPSQSLPPAEDASPLVESFSAMETQKKEKE